MTAFEFNAVLDGCATKQDTNMRTWAWGQANVINGIRQVKRTTPVLRPEKLYRSRQASKEFASVEEFTEHMCDQKRDED